MRWQLCSFSMGSKSEMYLTGGGTHPGSGLPVIFHSARISSKPLLDDLGVEPQWATSSERAMNDEMMQVAS